MLFWDPSQKKSSANKFDRNVGNDNTRVERKERL